jgi:hypothetical protein
VDPQVIAGRYEVVRAIGSGGMGTVWLCRDNVLGREVAVKQIGALPGEPAAAARAMREARITASLNHPNAVGVFDVVDEDDAHWLVMEFVDGQSLAELIHEHGNLPPTRVASIGAAVAGALARAHERGIVHRDIKPGNILIDNAGTPKISDFGIARAHTDDQLTQTGFVTGTPGYLSPELARGASPTPASDVWALGATLYYAVEGRPAFEPQTNPLAVLQDVANHRARPMEHAGPLAGAISAMMAPDPEQRWDMATAAQKLRSVAEGDRTMALPAGAVPGVATAAGAAAVAAGADATEVIAQPADATQRIEATPLPAQDDTARVPTGATDAAPEEPEERRRRGWVIALVVLVLAALVAAAWVLTDGFGTQGTPTTTTTTSPTGPTQTQTDTPTGTTSEPEPTTSEPETTTSEPEPTTSEPQTTTEPPQPSQPTTTSPPQGDETTAGGDETGGDQDTAGSTPTTTSTDGEAPGGS